MSRDELVQKIAKIDYWGARGWGPSVSTAESIVRELERLDLIKVDKSGEVTHA